MLPVTPSRRLAAQLALVGGPALVIVSTATQPELSGSAAQRLQAIADAPLAGLSAAAFVVSQVPFLVAVLAIGLLLVPSAPRLSAWGTGFGVLGCVGHFVYGGISLAEVMMAGDEPRRASYVHFLDELESSPVMVFAAVGLLGTVLGILLLSIGLFRSGTGPVWVGPALWAFLVVEFAGTALSSYATYLSALLLLAAFGALVPLVREPDEERALVAG